MQSVEAKCPACSKFLLEIDFKNHLKKCEKYGPLQKNRITDISDDLTIGQMHMMIAEFELSAQNISDFVQKQFEKQKNHSGVLGLSKINNVGISFSGMNSDIVRCKKCDKKFYSSLDFHSLFYVEGCWHLFCKSCIVKHFDEFFVEEGGSLKCLVENCTKIIQENQLKALVGHNKYEAQQVKAIRKMMNIVQCQKCKIQFEFVQGKPEDSPAKDANGKQMNQQLRQHYAQNRFICPQPQCKTQQCKSCQFSPYHIGMTCKQYKERMNMKLCRYCDEPIKKENLPKTNKQALKDICNKEECQTTAHRACLKMLPCNHPCCGFKDQKKCLPCLSEECCAKNQELKEQKGDDYCNICFIEALKASPCVRSSCGHIFHEKCLQKRYEIKWLTPRILFNFCLCPLCKEWIELPQQNILSSEIVKNLKLFQDLQRMSYQRLKFQECLKDERLTNPQSPYYQKPQEYAMAIFAYFMCFKCKKPYFGGRKNCADAMMEPQNQGQFKEQELICPNCCQIPIENCPKHGNNFIEFKCQFCCSIAQWFCWGTTHFCDKCHKRQCNHDYVTKIPKNKLPKCPGPGSCPIGGDHGGNGKQKSLGCAICRNFKQNNKGF